MSRFRLLVSLLALALVAALPLAGQAAPTCPEPATQPACGNRVIAPPLQSVSFVQYATEYLPALEAIEKIAPGVIEVEMLGDLIGRPELRSQGGRQIPIVRLTDESVTTPKRQVAISLSVHGNESAGREGGLRYIEDIARWHTNPATKDRLLYSGDAGVPLSQVLAETEIWIGIVNVDGWAGGDIGGTGGTFSRGNARGVDLNREFPTIGWTKRSATPLSEPESQGWDALVSGLDNLTTATDIHGELTSANNAFSDLMYPAGQWSPRRQAQELQFAKNMVRTVERKFAEEGVVLQDVFDLQGDDRQMKPAEFATAYDVVGYDDSGFMGDYFVSKGAVEMDVENFLSHMAPGNVWIPALEQAHVAAVKGNMESTIVESMITHQVQSSLDLGRIAYIDDPARVTSTDGLGFEPEAGEDPKPYDVSRLQYFVDLAKETAAAAPATAPAPAPTKGKGKKPKPTAPTAPASNITPLAAADVATTDLSVYDSIVVADMTVPADTQGRAVDAAAYTAALQRFAAEGGQLVLTDSAAQLVPQLTSIPADAVKTGKTNAGHIDFGTLNHPWEADLTPTASQTYYEVPLGYTATNQAPHWGILQTAWESAGGTTVGTVTAGGSTFSALGELPVGAGSIVVYGAILPTQTEANPHLYGLADYGVTVAGGQVLHKILGARR